MSARNKPNFTIQHMQPDMEKEAFSIIDAENWISDLDPVSLVYHRYPHCFFVAVTDDKEIAATMSLLPSYGNVMVLGYLIVKSTFRRMGLGRKMITECLKNNPDKVITLHAVPGVDQFYIKTGFKSCAPQQTHTRVRMTVEEEKVKRMMNSIAHKVEDITVTPLDGSDTDQLLAYDTEARGYNCSMYISILLQCSTVLKAVNTKTSTIVGYVSATLKRGEISVHGLYADSDDIAKLLFRNTMDLFPGETNLTMQYYASRTFLKNLGHVTESGDHIKYTTGTPCHLEERKAYCITDCGFTC